MMLDDEISSLFSLLGLLEPSEYFITVDHSALWQKHISWAKSKGEDLRSHITQRYASSMVFLSCLLAAQINVFFNSSKEITEMRACLATQRMFTLKYWIGVVLMADICVTLLALVNTYTLSKLIASISDSNAHAMLRSSIGSYVAVLPSRFTVAALYLFLGWIAMFIWDFFAGPIHFVFLFLVLLMFFHVIIPLSAFGRLIIHTGAMGRRPVLDVELEKELLPSGLHNSLLIRATDRKRKYNSSATDQYRKPARNHSHSTRNMHPLGATAATATGASIPSSNTTTMYGTSSNFPPGTMNNGRRFSGAPSLHTQQTPTSLHPPRDITFRQHQDSDDLTMDDDGEDGDGGGGGGGNKDQHHQTDEEDDNNSGDSNQDHRNHHRYESGQATGMTDFSSEMMGGGDTSMMMDPESLMRGGYSDHYYAPTPRGHRRIQTVDTVGSDNFFFPGAAILNATTSTRDIHNIVQQSMYLSASGAGASGTGAAIGDATSIANTSSASALLYSSGGFSMASAAATTTGDVSPSQRGLQYPPPPPHQHHQQTIPNPPQLMEAHQENPESIVPAASTRNTEKDHYMTNEDSSGVEVASTVVANNRSTTTTTPETINKPAGLARNLSTSSGHRRQMSSGGGSPRLSLPVLPNTPESHVVAGTPNIMGDTGSRIQQQQQDDIHAGMRYPSPDITSARSRKSYPPPMTPPYPQQQQQQQSDPQRHPLLMSPPGTAPASKPPTHRQMNRHSHRRHSSAARRSSGSFFGFIPLPSPAESELEEDNAIRASMGVPLAPDLASQERLVEEQKNFDYSEPPPPEAVASHWLAMHQQQTPGTEGDGGRRRSSSTGNMKRDAEEVVRTSGSNTRSNSRRNLMMAPNASNNSPLDNSRRNLLLANHDSGGGSYRSSKSNSRRNLGRQQGSDDQQQDRTSSSGSSYRGSGPGGSRRNLMATIRSHPDEEKEEAEDEEEARANSTRRPTRIQNREASFPEETTRLLADHDEDRGGGRDSADENGAAVRRSYT